MTAATIAIGCTGPRSGFVIATMPREDPHTSAERLVAGDVRRISPDGEPEKWRAWLWPSPGGVMHVTQSCEAVDAPALARLRDKLQKRGPWWSA